MPFMVDTLLAHELAQPYPSAVRIVAVKIRDRGEVKKFDAGEAALALGDRVLRDGGGELGYGGVYGGPQLMPFIPPMRVMQPIVRKATSEDDAAIDRHERLASEGMKAGREQAAALGLKMKLVEVFCSFHRRQMTFVYTAEDRIDFRELVRRLARRFGGRIEMRQVGPRPASARAPRRRPRWRGPACAACPAPPPPAGRAARAAPPCSPARPAAAGRGPT